MNNIHEYIKIFIGVGSYIVPVVEERGGAHRYDQATGSHNIINLIMPNTESYMSDFYWK